jgi:lactate dehydrogenase-like 2-hydroxyacid dehydrogenase
MAPSDAPVVLQVGQTMPELAESLRASYDVVTLPEQDPERSTVLAEHGPGVTVAAVSFGAPFGAELFEALPRLGAVANFGVGYDNIDLAEARRRGVVVSNTPDVLTDSVAELAVGLALDVLRRVSAADRYVRAGRWSSDGGYPLSRQLSGRRVGILGLGRIGLAIARRVEAFGCPVGYHSRNPVAGVNYEYAESPRDLAATSEVLVVVVPGTGGTHGIVDRSVLEALGADGVLVNVARGSVVDEEAMVDLLVDGRLGGAGLDVYADEPEVPEMLLALDSVVLTPHVGSATHEARTGMAGLVLDNVRSYLSVGTLVTPVAD